MEPNQPVLDWLNAVCNNAYGSEEFSGGNDDYGGRDTRNDFNGYGGGRSGSSFGGGEVSASSATEEA